MAKISTYPGPSSPSLSDMLIGTDVNDMLMTKNFTISDIISVAGSSTYVPYTGGNNDVFLPGYGFYANEFVVYGGSSSQFLKADGSIDSNAYALASSIPGLVPYTGATGNVDLGANRIITDAVLARASTGILYLSLSPFDFVGAKFDFVTSVYSFGDYTSLSGGTYIKIDDANTRIELSKGIYTNGSEGTIGNILVSQGAGLPATWVLPSFVPYTGATGDVNLGIYKLTANRLVGNVEVRTPLLSSTSNNFFIGDPTNTFSGLWLNFSGKKYYLGDVSTQLNGTMLTVDDLNNRIEINSQFYTNGSVGTSGQVLISQGAGLPPTWTSALASIYGSFHDVNSQTTLGSTEELMQFGTTNISAGVTIVNNGLGDPTRITVASTGVYNIQFSAQLTKTGGSLADIYIYLKKNGIIVPNSNTQLTLANNGHYIVASWNFFVQLNTGQYAEIAWYATNANVELYYNATPVVGLPAIPSTILTVNKIS